MGAERLLRQRLHGQNGDLRRRDVLPRYKYRGTTVTPGRRTLRYESFDEVMPDVERLLEGHRTVGNWSLARFCHHLAAVLRRHVDLPATTQFDPDDRVSEEQKRRVFETGDLPE